ncbi:MAG: metallophosphoesterase family protein [Candidatus Hydrogenedentota bacterium]
MAVLKDRFVHIADLHFWEVVLNPLKLLNKRMLGNANVVLRRRHEFQVHFAEEYADAVAALGINTAVLTGDFTSTATEREFEAAQAFTRGLAARGLEVVVMPGNHDVYTFGSVRRKRFEVCFGDYMPAKGYPARLDLPGGTPLIIVPTVTPNILSSKGRITPAQVAASQALVRDTPDTPVVVAGHYPLLHRTHAYTTSSGRQLRNAASLRAMLAGAERDILYVAGHVHRFSYVQDPDHARLVHLTTPALFLHRRKEDIRGAFSEVHVYDDGTFRVFEHINKGTWQRCEAVRVA